MKTFELLGYFIDLKDPEKISIEKYIVKSEETLRYIFNVSEFDREKDDRYFLINKSAINVDDNKERLIHAPGMGCFIKNELL